VTFGEDDKVYARTERRPSTQYDRRQRLKKDLGKMREKGAHLLADAAVCGRFDGFEMGGIREDVEAIKTQLDVVITTLDQSRVGISSGEADE